MPNHNVLVANLLLCAPQPQLSNRYSAEFALRSYTYLWLHAGPSLLCKALGLSRATAFYATRAALGSVSALSETAFLQALGRRYVTRGKHRLSKPLAWMHTCLNVFIRSFAFYCMAVGVLFTDKSQSLVKRNVATTMTR
jgi:hypothetical protein